MMLCVSILSTPHTKTLAQEAVQKVDFRSIARKEATIEYCDAEQTPEEVKMQ